MSTYPVILIPEAIKPSTEAQIKPSQPTRPKQPKRPPSLPPEPQPLNSKELLLWGGGGLLISLLAGVLLSFISQGWGLGLMSIGFVLMLIIILINASVQLKSFPKRKQANEQLQQQYLLRLERYAITLAEFDRKQAEYTTALKEYGAVFKVWEQQSTQNKSIFTDLVTYQGINSQAKRGHSEEKFERRLRQYFGNKIKTGVWLQNPDFDKGFHYTPDFAYIDKETLLHIDIEIDEPYGYKSRQPLHYLDLDTEISRDDFFIDCLWIVIRFSEEQVVKYPNNCCKEIAKVISQVTGNNFILSPFFEVENLELVERWTYDEAVAMAENNYPSKLFLKGVIFRFCQQTPKLLNF